MATLTITFTHPGPPPSNGFQIRYRALGSLVWNGPYTVSGSPAVFTNAPDGVDIEGEIYSDCKTLQSESNAIAFLAYRPGLQCLTYQVTTQSNDPVYVSFSHCNGDRDQLVVQNGTPVTICALEDSFSSDSLDFNAAIIGEGCDN
jgi:hypothetical protein